VPIPIPRTRSELAPLLESRGLRLTKRLGQNFIVDPALADAIVADAGVRSDDLVLEIGAGAGGLTQPLLAAAGHVVAIALERGMAALLAEYLGDHERFTLHEGDALEGPEGLHPAITEAIDDAGSFGCARVLVVANLPYSCGTAVVSRLLRRDRTPAEIVAMLQKEVVERLRAQPGTSDYGPLAVLGSLRAEVALVRKVPPQVFLPRPAVDSAVFRVTPRADADAASARAAVDLAAVAFRMRRKRLARALKGTVDTETIVAAGLDPDARPERVTPAEWAVLGAVVAGRG
jgi:16S rRNA (adenine1518-N6/adenine1519-N6)-dimethyltransferase